MRALEELASLEPEQGQHGEHLQHNQGLGGPAHHGVLLKLGFRHQLKGLQRCWREQHSTGNQAQIGTHQIAQQSDRHSRQSKLSPL